MDKSTKGPETNSMEYYILSTFNAMIGKSENDNLRQTYDNGKLIYLDDDISTLRAFVGIIEGMASSSFSDAPAHLIGDLRELDDQDIKNILKDYDVLLYGRSGMRLNSKILQSLIS